MPFGYGICVFPISLARTDHKTGQSAQEYFEFLCDIEQKLVDTKMGLNLIYADFLYLNSKKPSFELKNKFMGIISHHSNEFKKLVKKHQKRFQIRDAFHYSCWSKLYFDYKKDFSSDFAIIKRIYENDLLFQKYVIEDCAKFNKEHTIQQVEFFLEEFFIFYLLSKGTIELSNNYVLGRQNWILWCYPGFALKGQAYLYQLNPLGLNNPKNKYENCSYDLTSKKLIDYTKIDLEEYNYTY